MNVAELDRLDEENRMRDLSHSIMEDTSELPFAEGSSAGEGVSFLLGEGCADSEFALFSDRNDQTNSEVDDQPLAAAPVTPYSVVESLAWVGSDERETIRRLTTTGQQQEAEISSLKLQLHHSQLQLQALASKERRSRQEKDELQYSLAEAEQDKLLLETRLRGIAGFEQQSAPLNIEEVRGKLLQVANEKLAEVSEALAASETSNERLQQRSETHLAELAAENAGLRKQLDAISGQLAQRAILYAAQERRALEEHRLQHVQISDQSQAIITAQAKLQHVEEQLKKVTDEKSEAVLSFRQLQEQKKTLELEQQVAEERIERLEVDLTEASAQNLQLQSTVEQLRGSDLEELEIQLTTNLEKFKLDAQNREEQLRQQLEQAHAFVSQEANRREELLDELQHARQQIEERDNLLSQMREHVEGRLVSESLHGDQYSEQNVSRDAMTGEDHNIDTTIAATEATENNEDVEYEAVQLDAEESESWLIHHLIQDTANQAPALPEATLNAEPAAVTQQMTNASPGQLPSLPNHTELLHMLINELHDTVVQRTSGTEGKIEGEVVAGRICERLSIDAPLLKIPLIGLLQSIDEAVDAATQRAAQNLVQEVASEIKSNCETEDAVNSDSPPQVSEARNCSKCDLLKKNNKKLRDFLGVVLHRASKMHLFGVQSATITSSNSATATLLANHEFTAPMKHPFCAQSSIGEHGELLPQKSSVLLDLELLTNQLQTERNLHAQQLHTYQEEMRHLEQLAVQNLQLGRYESSQQYEGRISELEAELSQLQRSSSVKVEEMQTRITTYEESLYKLNKQLEHDEKAFSKEQEDSLEALKEQLQKTEAKLIDAEEARSAGSAARLSLQRREEALQQQIFDLKEKMEQQHQQIEEKDQQLHIATTALSVQRAKFADAEGNLASYGRYTTSLIECISDYEQRIRHFRTLLGKQKLVTQSAWHEKHSTAVQCDCANAATDSEELLMLRAEIDDCKEHFQLLKEKHDSECVEFKQQILNYQQELAAAAEREQDFAEEAESERQEHIAHVAQLQDQLVNAKETTDVLNIKLQNEEDRTRSLQEIIGEMERRQIFSNRDASVDTNDLIVDGAERRKVELLQVQVQSLHETNVLLSESLQANEYSNSAVDAIRELQAKVALFIETFYGLAPKETSCTPLAEGILHLEHCTDRIINALRDSSSMHEQYTQLLHQTAALRESIQTRDSRHQVNEHSAETIQKMSDALMASVNHHHEDEALIFKLAEQRAQIEQMRSREKELQHAVEVLRVQMKEQKQRVMTKCRIKISNMKEQFEAEREEMVQLVRQECEEIINEAHAMLQHHQQKHQTGSKAWNHNYETVEMNFALQPLPSQHEDEERMSQPMVVTPDVPAVDAENAIPEVAKLSDKTELLDDLNAEGGRKQLRPTACDESPLRGDSLQQGRATTSLNIKNGKLARAQQHPSDLPRPLPLPHQSTEASFLKESVGVAGQKQRTRELLLRYSSDNEPGLGSAENSTPFRSRYAKNHYERSNRDKQAVVTAATVSPDVPDTLQVTAQDNGRWSLHTASGRRTADRIAAEREQHASVRSRFQSRNVKAHTSLYNDNLTAAKYSGRREELNEQRRSDASHGSFTLYPEMLSPEMTLELVHNIVGRSLV